MKGRQFYVFGVLLIILKNSVEGYYQNESDSSSSSSEEIPDDARLGFVVVDTKLGKVRGIKANSRQGKPFAFFKGIPYAKAPLGELRYEPPKPHERWSGIRDGTKFGAQCIQVNLFNKEIVGNEDCLFLNVATRKSYKNGEVPQGTRGLHPVLVYIHGGLFMFGKGDPFRPKYFLDEDVVLVTINYRLNSFGFLNSGDGIVRGNMGLRDQVQAFKWIQENIKYFNGDPSRVTIMGESAGGVSTHLHSLSPMSRGLFSGVISMSGTALSPWGHVDNPVKQALEFGNALGCPTGNSWMMVSCLRKISANKLARYHLDYINQGAEGKQSLFGPTVDSGNFRNKFLPEDPLELLRSGKISRKPWLTGVNSGDGLVFLIPILRNEALRRAVSSRWEHYAPILLGYQNQAQNKRVDITSDLSSHYLKDNVGISHNLIKESSKMFSDRGFNLDNHDAAIFQSQVAPVYTYYYSYQGLFSIGNLLFTKTNLPIPNNWNYLLGGALMWWKAMIFNGNSTKNRKFDACHGDELPLLFNMPLMRKEVTLMDVDYQFSRKLVSLYVSFAQKGKPDPFQSGESLRWNSLLKNSTNKVLQNLREEGSGDISLGRMRLDKKFEMIEEPFVERMQFWRKHSISYLFSKENAQRNNTY